MKLGICYPYELEPRAALDLVMACEERGLDSVWVVENPGWPGAFATAGAVAAITSRMLVSIGVVSAFTRSASVLAVEAGQVQKLSTGRFRFGLGVGSVRVLGDLGIDTSQPVEGIAETVKVLRAIFDGGIEGHQGKRHTVRQFKLAFDVKPAPTIHIGTMGPKMTVLAGRVADGLIVSTHTPIEATKQNVSAARAACREAGRSPDDFHVTAFVIASIAGTTAEAREALRPRQAIDIWRITRNVPSFAQTLSAIGLDERKIAAIKNAARPQDIIGLIDDSVLDALCFAGDAAAFERRLLDLQAAGVDEVVLFQAAEEHDFKNHMDDLVVAARNVGALKRSGNHAR
jgi:5,10-methylenetetrahydromethanopterin reductase